jgi:hypothetical protein
MLPNRASGPQNQPKAKVAVSISVGAAWSNGGMEMLTIGSMFIGCMAVLSLFVSTKSPSLPVTEHPLMKPIRQTRVIDRIMVGIQIQS